MQTYFELKTSFLSGQQNIRRVVSHFVGAAKDDNDQFYCPFDERIIAELATTFCEPFCVYKTKCIITN